MRIADNAEAVIDGFACLFKTGTVPPVLRWKLITPN